jgi:raffinose/stachyose/melibiose transport system substrate-binding protein
MKSFRVTAAVLAVVMITLLPAGCANKSAATANGPIYIKDKDTSNKVINFFINQSNQVTLDIMNEAATKFESDTGIKVTFSNYVQDTNQGTKSYDQVARERIESNKPDDVYILNAGVLQDEVEKGNIEPLSYLEGMDSLTEEALNGSKVRGVQYCLPMFMSAYSFYANTEILKANGLSIPANLSEFRNCCSRLKAAGITPFEGDKWWTEELVLAGGMSDLYFDNGSADDLNSGKTPISTYLGKGFQLVEDMDKQGYMNLKRTYDIAPGEEVKDLIVGKCAFAVSMAAIINEEYALNTRDKYTVTGVPVREDGSVVLMNPDLRICVCSKGANTEAAKKFVTYLTSKEVTDKFLTLEGRYSIRKDADVKAAEVVKGVDDCVKTGRTMPCQNYGINVEQWENVCKILWKMMQEGMTAKEAGAEMDKLQKAANGK